MHLPGAREECGLQLDPRNVGNGVGPPEKNSIEIETPNFGDFTVNFSPQHGTGLNPLPIMSSLNDIDHLSYPCAQ